MLETARGRCVLSDAVVIAVIAAMPGFLMTLGTLSQVRRVHVLVNSQKDALTHLLKEALATIETLENRARHSTLTIAHLRAQIQGVPTLDAPDAPEEG